MPLHYALEAYLAWLKRNRNSVPDAVADATLLEQIHDALNRHSDRDQQPKNVIQEIRALIATRDEDAAGSPVVVAAKINAKYVLAGVIVTAVLGTLGAAVITNSDKLFGSKPPTVTATPIQTTGGPQSPNIANARDVTIHYGPPPNKEVEIPNIAGKWRTQAFTNVYAENERSRLLLEFVQQGATFWGSVTHTDPDGSNASTAGIIDGRITGKGISFYTRGEVNWLNNSTLSPTRLACNEYPVSSRQCATVTHVMRCPKRVNSSAKVRVDLLAQRNILIGSQPWSPPESSPITPVSRGNLLDPLSFSTHLSHSAFAGFVSFPLPFSSFTALVMVVRDSPVKADSRLMPPRPQSRALSAANSRG